jgi:MFS family permease
MSQFFSQIAIQTVNYLVIIKVFEATKSTIATSLVWIAFILPSILIGPFAAAFVDLADRKKILRVANLSQAIIIIVFALIHSDFLFLSYAVVFLYSVFNQFYIPAEVSSLPFLVSGSNIHKANSLFLISYQVALLIGFGAAGIVRELIGLTATMIVAGLFVFFAYISVGSLPAMKGKEVKLIALEKQLANFFKDIVDGYAFIRDNHKVLMSFVVMVTLQVNLAIITVNLPILGRDLLGIKPSYAGLFIVPASLGAVIGITTVSRLITKKVKKEQMVLSGLTLLILSMLIMMAVVPMLNGPYNRILSFLLVTLMGYGFIGGFIPSQTTLYLNTPKEFSARVFGNAWFVTTTATILPLMFSATITEILGGRVLFFLLSVALSLILFSYKKYAAV